MQINNIIKASINTRIDMVPFTFRAPMLSRRHLETKSLFLDDSKSISVLLSLEKTD